MALLALLSFKRFALSSLLFKSEKKRSHKNKMQQYFVLDGFASQPQYYTLVLIPAFICVGELGIRAVSGLGGHGGASSAHWLLHADLWMKKSL